VADSERLRGARIVEGISGRSNNGIGCACGPAADAYITPAEARKLAAALVELADYADGVR
jgi:hypothetical protein